MKSFLIVFFLVVSAYSQEMDYRALDNSKGTSMKPILAAAFPAIQIVEEKGGEIVRMEFDIIQTEKITYRELHAGVEYGIFVFGDYRIKDIDLVLYKSIRNEWVEIKRDTDRSSTASVEIEPSFTGLYAIKVIAYKFYEDYTSGHYGLMVIR